MKKLSPLVLLPFVATPLLAQELTCPDFPHFSPTSGPLTVVNCYFHHQYEDRIKQILATFGAPNGRPIIINLDGLDLILKYNGKTQTIKIADATYQDLKVFGHASLSVLIILSQQAPGKLTEATLNKIQQLKIDLHAAVLAIPSLKISPQAKQLAKNLAEITESYLDKLLLTKQWTSAELAAYYKEAVSFINMQGKMAAETELANLDRALNQWLAPMSAEEKKRIGIVVGVVHQARAREHIIMYLSKRFSRPAPSEGALNENGLVVAEGLFDENAALALLARHYLDRDIGEIVFAEVERMQKDLMAKPGKEWIARHPR